MSEPDLTEPVDVAGRARYERWIKEEQEVFVGATFKTWDELHPNEKRLWRQQALDWIFPAAQLIYDQGKKDLLEELRYADAIHEWYFDEENE